MAKVITFSREFPSYHPKKGQPTYFVEKFYNSLFSRNNFMDYPKGLEINEIILEIKNHTIRAGNRFKKGEINSTVSANEFIEASNNLRIHYQQS